MSDLDALYPKPILRLASEAQGAGRLADPDATVTRVNPLCGDKIVVDIKRKGDAIAALGYDAKACVLCQASASALGAAAVGHDKADIDHLRAALDGMLKASGTPPGGAFARFADLAPVAAFPSRHQCVLLPIDALLEALA